MAMRTHDNPVVSGCQFFFAEAKTVTKAQEMAQSGQATLIDQWPPQMSDEDVARILDTAMEEASKGTPSC